ncbi:MAG TPA: hypothetical protein VN654_05235 [Vicinamibacterales bacterium]|nr:hypothetical protein [Vicinamibacterales bacterium]
MAVGKQGSAQATISIDDHGGVLRDITAHVRTIGGLKITQITEENSPFGVAFEKNTPVGKQKFGPVTIAGDFDSSPTTGPHVVFGTLETLPGDSTRTLTIVPGDSKTLSGEGYVTEYELVLTDGKLTGYTAQYVQAGLFAWT